MHLSVRYTEHLQGKTGINNDSASEASVRSTENEKGIAIQIDIPPNILSFFH